MLQPEACNFIKKESLAQVFSCEFCETFKNTFSKEHFQETAFNISERYLSEHFTPAEAYPEPFKTSKMELVAKTVNG